MNAPGKHSRQSDARRGAQLAKIHICKDRLGLTDELYRAIIARVANGKTTSAAELDGRGRGHLLDEFARLGSGGTDNGAKQPKRIIEKEPQLKIIRLLWHDLAALGALHDASEKALRCMLKRIAKVEALAWLTPTQANKVIEGLKAMRHRAERAAAGEVSR